MRLGRTFLCALLVSMVFVLVAWPGAGTRGVIAEEVQPYLLRYPRLIDQSPNGVVMLPPNDAPDGPPRFVGSEQWPELGYNGKHRVYPLFVRGHQTALGTWFGIVLQPVLGGGIAAVRRSSVLMALSLVILTFGLARRLGLSLAWSTAAALGLALSPGFWFFARTGYAFELASRVLMGACLFVAAPLAKIDRRRGILVAIFFGLAILARATIATTMAPALLVMLFHPKRDPGRKSIAGILALAGGIPIVTVAIALLTLPFGTSPAQNLRVAALAGRTLVAPATALVQLAWVVDARVILRPLIEGDLKVHVAPLLGILGGVSAIAALARWWNARATEGERMFIASLLGNALFGAWMYGNPGQFQLGLGLEPLFVIAVAGQLASIPRYSWVFAIGLLGARVATLASIAATERHTQNPMLDGKAQRDLVALLEARKVPADDLITTTYDHVGVIEAWTDERYRPVHAWRILRVSGFPEERVVESWKKIFAAHPACHVLLTTAPNLVAGSFTDNALVARALERFATERGQEVVRTPVRSEWGREIFELIELRGCKAP